LTRSDETKRRRITLKADGRCAGGSWKEHHWTVAHVEGRPLLILASTDRATAILGRDRDGCWRNHGAGVMLARLVPDGWQTRETFDLVIFDEVVRQNEYRLPDRFEPGDVVVDVGAHQGSFAKACLDRVATEIHCIEPNPDNLALLARNVGWITPAVRIYPVAAWSEFATLKLDFPGGAMHSGGGCVVNMENGIEVAAVPFDTILGPLLDAGKRIRLVKFDCEGSEFKILESTAEVLHQTLEVVGEYHLARLDRRFSLSWLVHRLERFGFTVTTTETGPEIGHFFARRG
jgi:FkbM family methyltransferase